MFFQNKSKIPYWKKRGKREEEEEKGEGMEGTKKVRRKDGYNKYPQETKVRLVRRKTQEFYPDSGI